MSNGIVVVSERNFRTVGLSLVMLLSSWKYHLKCDLQKFGENGIIHGQPGFEKTETNMFITMHAALDRKRTQILSFSYDQRETA